MTGERGRSPVPAPCPLSPVPRPSAPFSALVVQEFWFHHVTCEPAASHRNEDVQVEAVVGLPEEEDEDEAEEAGAGQTPVQPGQL